MRAVPWCLCQLPGRPAGGWQGQSPHATGPETDGHIPAGWFRRQVWYPARDAAGLAGLRVHDLRHAHVFWLLAGGADLQVVKERLGHASIVTTERYLHSLPTADETALDALSRIRGPHLVRPA
jgi:integrase